MQSETFQKILGKLAHKNCQILTPSDEKIGLLKKLLG